MSRTRAFASFALAGAACLGMVAAQDAAPVPAKPAAAPSKPLPPPQQLAQPPPKRPPGQQTLS